MTTTANDTRCEDDRGKVEDELYRLKAHALQTHIEADTLDAILERLEEEVARLRTQVLDHLRTCPRSELRPASEH